MPHHFAILYLFTSRGQESAISLALVFSTPRLSVLRVVIGGRVMQPGEPPATSSFADLPISPKVLLSLPRPSSLGYKTRHFVPMWKTSHLASR